MATCTDRPLTSFPTPNNLNQYTNVGGVTVSNGGNGNLTSYNGWNYTYDSMNRLTYASGPGGVYAKPSYDGLGRQITWESNGPNGIINLWDGWNLAAAYSPGGSTPLARLFYAGNDLVRVTWPQILYYYPDAQGSTTHLADASGNLLERYTYDAYGKPTFYNAAGTVLPNGSAYGVEFLYTGQDWLSDLGLYDLRNRHYIPSLGRFLQPDPIGFGGDSSNLYRYCANNPVNASDPYGLWTFQLGLSLTGQWGPLTVNYNGGIVVDGHGNFGTFNTGLLGGGVGGGVSGGISLLGSNGDVIGDLNKDFTNVSVGGYAGGGAAAEGFEGRGSHNQIVTGGGAVFGFGLGGGGSVGRSLTVVTPINQANVQPVAPIDPSIPVYEHITVTGKPVPEPAPPTPGNLVSVRGPSGRVVQAPRDFALWLGAFPDSLLSHLLADSPTAQNAGVGSYAPSGNRIPSGSGEQGPPPPSSAAYSAASLNP